MLWSFGQYFQEDVSRRISFSRSTRGTEVLVESFTKHPNYNNNNNHNNDIAVIKMKTKVGFTNFIQPLCLLYQNKNGIEEFISSAQFEIGSKTLQAAGWGTTNYQGTSGAGTVLRIVNQIRILPNDVCNRTFGVFGPKVLDNEVCAQGDNQSGVCTGDSGGPLMISLDGRNYLYGVSSRVTSHDERTPCTAILPSIFVDVKSFTTFLKETIGGKKRT